MTRTHDAKEQTYLDTSSFLNKLERQIESLELENYILRSRLRLIEDRLDTLEGSRRPLR